MDDPVKADRDPDLVEREVRSADPSLSAEANRLLTAELRDAIGVDHVKVAPGTPDHRAQPHGTDSRAKAALVANRLLIVASFGVLVVLGAMASLATGSWWALAAAVAVHAVGTTLAVGVAIGLTTQTEHVAPQTAARLEAEGVSDPEAVFNDLVDDFAGASGPRGLQDVVTEGGDERTVDATDDPAQANAEHRSAMTPSSEASESQG